jgi:hypothetical protein
VALAGMKLRIVFPVDASISCRSLLSEKISRRSFRSLLRFICVRCCRRMSFHSSRTTVRSVR